MTISLGARPETLTVTLVEGADFITGLDSLDGDWPDTAVLSLIFNDEGPTVWTATTDAAAADWDVDKAEVAALIAALPSRRKVRLRYVDGTTDLIWAQGTVTVERWG